MLHYDEIVLLRFVGKDNPACDERIDIPYNKF